MCVCVYICTFHSFSLTGDRPSILNNNFGKHPTRTSSLCVCTFALSIPFPCQVTAPPSSTTALASALPVPAFLGMGMGSPKEEQKREGREASWQGKEPVHPASIVRPPCALVPMVCVESGVQDWSLEWVWVWVSMDAEEGGTEWYDGMLVMCIPYCVSEYVFMYYTHFCAHRYAK